MKYEYSKTISIYENYLWIKYQLRNIGSVAFNTTEYCHNFLAVNNRPLDASYRLKIKQPIMPEHFSERVNTDGLLAFGKNEITLKTTPDSDFFIAQLNGDNQKCTGWQLENTEEKAAVSEVVDFEPMQMNLWGTTHVISPELFFNTILLPQEEAVWRRKFTFYEL